MSQLTVYDELNQVLAASPEAPHPSEAHGILCGVLCGKMPNQVPWRDWILGSSQEVEALQMLDRIFNKTAQELNDLGFGLELLLPDDDDTDLSIRVEALTEWCQGFLTGLKLMGITLEGLQTEDAKEGFRDLQELSTMNASVKLSSDLEEDETAYAELVEYVRLASIVIYEDIQDKHQEDVDND